VNRIEKFEHDGNEYEIRATRTEHGYSVRTFSGDTPASPTYSVTFDVAVDYVNAGWGDAVEELISMARSDIEKGRLTKLAHAIEAAK
jgi:hypothetical protein